MDYAPHTLDKRRVVDVYEALLNLDNLVLVTGETGRRLKQRLPLINMFGVDLTLVVPDNIYRQYRQSLKHTGCLDGCAVGEQTMSHSCAQRRERWIRAKLPTFTRATEDNLLAFDASKADIDVGLHLVSERALMRSPTIVETAMVIGPQWFGRYESVRFVPERHRSSFEIWKPLLPGNELAA